MYAMDACWCNEPLHRGGHARAGTRRGARDDGTGATHQSGRALFDGEFCQHHIDAELQAFIESRKAELLH